MAYFNNVNPDLLDRLPLNARTVVEIGCGSGSLAQAYRARNPACRYIGVELFEAAAQAAEAVTHQVICGNIEDAGTQRALADATRASADLFIFGDVLEHLQNPWQVLQQLHAHATDDAHLIACIPNVAHWSLLLQQLQGQWNYADAGLLDRTHLRFFTLDSAIDMLRTSGWQVIDAKPRVLQTDKTRAAVQVFQKLAPDLNLDAKTLERNLSAFQWVIRASKQVPQPRLNIKALCLKPVAGVTHARIDHPLRALNTRPDISAQWSSQGIPISGTETPGVLILHRQFVNEPGFRQRLDDLAARGWILVSEMDDDPHHWKAYVDSDFYAFRAVHAVSVSTPAMAALMQQWNPHVQIFPNAMPELPPAHERSSSTGGPVRIFFGALNRKDDWASIADSVIPAALALGERIAFEIVHERSVFDALPAGIPKRFHPTLAPADYLQQMSRCDIALLPLRDTSFNRLKSDLKLIESCASGVVPICSRIVYADDPHHEEVAVFPSTPAAWGEALTTLVTNTELRQQKQEAGQRYVASQRMMAYQVDVRAHWYRSLLSNRNSLENERQQRRASCLAATTQATSEGT